MDTFTATFVARSAYNHLAYVLPAAKQRPSLYAGKAETLLLTLLLDILGVDPKDIPNRANFMRAVCAFHYIWRCMDEVVDEQFFTTDPITADDLDQTLVYHKYLNTITSAQKGWEVLYQAIPARFFEVAPLIYAYRSAIVRTANDPQYHTGAVLPFPLALQLKDEVTGLLGETGAEIALTLLGNDDYRAVVIYRITGLAIQFGDDLSDWRQDLLDYRRKSTNTHRQIRPIENLFLSTLTEFPPEWEKCENVLNDRRRSGHAWLTLLAPRALKEYNLRFLAIQNELPAHPKTPFVKEVLNTAFFKLLPQVSRNK